MKKTLLILTILVLTFAFTETSLAKPQQGLGKLAAQNKATAAAQRQEAALASLKQRAQKLVDQRIERLNKLLTRIQNDKKLSDADKAILTTDVQNAIASLSALKTKIANDTSAEEVRADVKKLAQDYKIYAVFEPKIRLLVTIGNLQNLSEKVSTLAGRLQPLIDEEKSKGKDVSELQSLLNDINNRLTDINTRLAADKAKVLAVSISSPDAKTVFVEVRKDLAGIRAQFAQIRHDIARMRNAFRISLKNATAAPRVSPTITPTPTP